MLNDHRNIYRFYTKYKYYHCYSKTKKKISTLVELVEIQLLLSRYQNDI